MNNIRQRGKTIYKVAEVITTVGLITVWAHVYHLHDQLPDNIPVQYNAGGQVTKNMSKGLFFIMPLIASIAWINTYRLHRVQYFNHPFLNNGTLPRIIVQVLILITTVVMINIAYKAVV